MWTFLVWLTEKRFWRFETESGILFSHDKQWNLWLEISSNQSINQSINIDTLYTAVQCTFPQTFWFIWENFKFKSEKNAKNSTDKQLNVSGRIVMLYSLPGNRSKGNRRTLRGCFRMLPVFSSHCSGSSKWLWMGLKELKTNQALWHNDHQSVGGKARSTWGSNLTNFINTSARVCWINCSARGNLKRGFRFKRFARKIKISFAKIF